MKSAELTLLACRGRHWKTISSSSFVQWYVSSTGLRGSAAHPFVRCFILLPIVLLASLRSGPGLDEDRA